MMRDVTAIRVADPAVRGDGGRIAVAAVRAAVRAALLLVGRRVRPAAERLGGRAVRRQEDVRSEPACRLHRHHAHPARG